MNAMFTNRVGDFFLTLGFFAIFFTFGTLDYATVFSLAPYININVITFISILLLLGAAAKSAQLGYMKALNNYFFLFLLKIKVVIL
jgi:NADH-ubiquinone oxidoreductase chain 5